MGVNQKPRYSKHLYGREIDPPGMIFLVLAETLIFQSGHIIFAPLISTAYEKSIKNPRIKKNLCTYSSSSRSNQKPLLSPKGLEEHPRMIVNCQLSTFEHFKPQKFTISLFRGIEKVFPLYILSS